MLFLQLPWTRTSMLGMVFVLVGYICWLNDFYNCHPTWYFHALWHIFMMMAIHTWIIRIDQVLTTD